MKTVRLIYYSKPAPNLKKADLNDILEESQVFNQQHGITGILVYDHHYFMQLLDGPEGPVNELFHKIMNDQRHQQVRLTKYNELTDKPFCEWSMAYARLPDFPQKLIDNKYGGFEPNRFSEEDAIAFLEMLRDYKLRH